MYFTDVCADEVAGGSPNDQIPTSETAVMQLTGVPPAVDTLARRISVLSALGRRAIPKSALVETLDHSRSTVDRAVAALEAAGYVEETADGYVRTSTGRLAAERYRAFVDDQQRLFDARALFAALPRDCDLPTTVLSDVAATPVDDTDELCAVLDDTLDDVECYRLVLPPVATSRHVERARAHASAGKQVDAVVPRESGGTVTESSERSVSPDGPVTETSAPPSGYGLLLWTPPDPARPASTLTIFVYDDTNPIGLLETSDECTVRWASTTIEKHLAVRHEDGRFEPTDLDMLTE
jgi:biotin operon repressor